MVVWEGFPGSPALPCSVGDSGSISGQETKVPRVAGEQDEMQPNQ